MKYILTAILFLITTIAIAQSSSQNLYDRYKKSFLSVTDSIDIDTIVKFDTDKVNGPTTMQIPSKCKIFDRSGSKDEFLLDVVRSHKLEKMIISDGKIINTVHIGFGPSEFFGKNLPIENNDIF